MSKEKQIEEMAKNRPYACGGSCENCIKCDEWRFAERLYNAGYRKQIEGAVVVHAHWIRKTDAIHFTHYECSNCGQKEMISGKKYCSECGAKMDEEGEWDQKWEKVNPYLDKTEFSK